MRWFDDLDWAKDFLGEPEYLAPVPSLYATATGGSYFTSLQYSNMAAASGCAYTVQMHNSLMQQLWEQPLR